MNNHVYHADRQTPGLPWPPEQVEMLTRHWHTMSDRDLAVLLVKHGPRRSVDAIAEKRLTLGLKRPLGPSSEKGRQTMASMAGWPVMRGSPEDRERRYLNALFDGLRAERDRMQGRGA